MKVDWKKSIREKAIAENKQKLIRHMNSNLTIWQLLTIYTLHFSFGFGKKRLLKFMWEIWDNQSWFDEYVRKTDSEMVLKKGNICTNQSATILKLINDLRRDGIEYTDILGDDVELSFVGSDGELEDIVKMDRNIQKGLLKMEGNNDEKRS